ncbi:F-box/LRR-repeat protein 14-like [Leptopilina boulardi]|uniref:F-box/LRR-repeat protein 14-like n=1 Tax=Leptopilina boulardi TaxID=63433 RepID=UPI0021F50A3D|nr:F-box/LRR-repeat protein 14-like [Leptopilina boulardi]XP_051167086.1 F-box/LRR-repeat protein 14-like [Leptopilina boulardi]
MEEGQLMTELPAITPNRGATLINRSGHCYQLHRPHLVPYNNKEKKSPDDDLTEEEEEAANAVTTKTVVATTNQRQDSGAILITTKRTAPTNLYTQIDNNGPSLKKARIQLQSPIITSTHVSNLYPEILAHIFSYLDVRDRGRASQVCLSWRDAAYHRSVWRGVEARLHLRRQAPALFSSLVRRGIKRVQVLSLKKGLGEVFKGMPNLEALNLSGCYNVTDSGLLSALSQEFPALTELNLSLCKQVTDTSVNRIAQYLKNLEHLELGGCGNITNTGLMLIAWGLKKLKKLDLRSCWHISDQGIANLAQLNIPLEHLGLQDCQKLSDESLRYVSNGLGKTLKSINLSFSCITDSGLKHLAKMSELQELDLRSCDNISEIGMAYLAEGGSRISSLDVSFCEKIGDQALVHISQGLFNLKSLSLSACQVSDEGICKIAKSLQDLETLNIGQCSKLTDKGLHTIADSMKHLKCIDLYGCTRITTHGLERIMKLPQLNTLNLGLWHVR